uniref:Uncharacterized protein n=1 Tax=Setaria italica TaxID=4555 RepID=K3YX89_SETIT
MAINLLGHGIIITARINMITFVQLRIKLFSTFASKCVFQTLEKKGMNCLRNQPCLRFQLFLYFLSFCWERDYDCSLQPERLHYC